MSVGVEVNVRVGTGICVGEEVAVSVSGWTGEGSGASRVGVE
jgi:hypothetical protein